MTRFRRALPLLVCLSILAAAHARAATTTTAERRNFEVISVNGNKVVYRGQEGMREVTLPADFKLTMDGREIGLADLKPGMKGTAIITTTTTSTPVTVTEVKSGEVMAVAGSAIIVKTEGTYKKFTQETVNDRNITIMRGGEKVDVHQLRVGDRLSAMIITQAAPKIVTEQQLKAFIESPPPAPAAAPPLPTAVPMVESQPAAAPAPAAEATAEPMPAAEPTAEPAPAAAPADAPAPVEEARGFPTWAWVLILLVVVIIVMLLLRRGRKS
jgi:hypothetical protein